MTAQRKTGNSRPSRRKPASVAATSATLAQRVRPWLLFVLLALVVARPLLPSEGVSWIGDGQPFNLLTICLGVAALGLATIERGFARRINLADVAVGALVVLCVAAGLYGTQYRTPRVSLNMLFEWIGLGLIFFLVRQLVRTARETRALVATMIALAVVMAAYSFYQVSVSLPATRAAYAENPDEVLQAAGQWFPPDSPERQQFENRLQSSEPIGTFALTNSLAGFLAPWFVIALGILLASITLRRTTAVAPNESPTTSRSTAVARFALAAAGVAAMAGCLLLTKSRSAYVAVAVGVLLLPLFDADLRRSFLSKRVVIAGSAVLLLLLFGAVAVGGLDLEVLTEAKKSLGYRGEYWRATLAMIGQHPWLGVGPGNFQDFYTRFKLPQASEEIRDPHNFLLEVWATAGTFALVAFGEALLVFGWRTWKMDSGAGGQSRTFADGPTFGAVSRRSHDREPVSGSDDPRSASAVLIVAGGGAGFLLAFLIAPGVGHAFFELQLAGGLLVGGCVMGLLWPWITRGRLSPRLPALGVLVLVIHLLAAGGIAYPGVAGTFWILFALGLNATDDATTVHAPATTRRRGAWGPAIGFVVACLAAVACYRFAYKPVLQCHAEMQRAADERLTDDARINLLVDAAGADPLAPEPWWAIAELELLRLKENPTGTKSMQRFVKATSKLLELRPYSAAAWRQTGRWFFELYTYNHQPGTAQDAMVCFRQAVDLYPTLAELRGEYALALSATGDHQGAQRQVKAARRMDKRTPHADKKLSPMLREQLDQIEAVPP